MNPLQVDDVLKIPAHQYRDAAYGRDGDVLGVGPHLGGEHTCGNVRFRKFNRLGIKLQRLDVRFGHGGKSPADRGRCRRQLLHREAGQDENTLTSDEALHKPDGVLRELFVLAPAHDRGVCVDPDRHRRMLTDVTVSILHRDSRRVLPCCPARCSEVGHN